MPRENSFSDEDGRSLTPDLSEDEGEIVSHSFSPLTEPPRASSPQLITASVDNASPTVAFPRPTLANGLSFLDTKPPSIRSPAGPGSAGPHTAGLRPGAATDRFRATVRKIMHMNRTSSVISNLGIGAEPGVDPRRASAHINYSHIKAKCTIDIVEYSSVRSSFGKMENKGFVDFLNDDRASKPEPWVKVRWINIGGISWDVISALALKYDIHPLAVEDILHQRIQARSKADYYMRHLFVRILRHSLAPEGSEVDVHDMVAPRFPFMPRSSSPGVIDPDDDDIDDDERTMYGSAGNSRLSTRKGNGLVSRHASNVLKPDMEQGRIGRPIKRSTTSSTTIAGRREAAKVMNLEELKKGRVHVQIKPMFMCLYRDGTVISIQSTPDPDFISPIVARLRQRDTGLRATADPSLLLQSLLDLVVDQALSVVDEYQKRILELEHDILIKPNMKSVRHLHILSGDLTLHKRTLDPIKTLVYGLRRYDVDRCAALVSSASSPGEKIAVQGFMSHKSKIYLADVHDHMDYILTSLDMFSNISENLINFTFNMASYEMNQVMRRLTLATIIFLPLTLLTGYFGMNFENMWSIHHGHTDIVFWIIALPCMAIVIPIFMWTDIKNAIHYLQKRHDTKTYIKTGKKMQ